MQAFLAPVGSSLIGITIDKYGRRLALLLTVIPSTVGWFLLHSSTSSSVILSAQCLIGITLGAIGYPSLVYAGECIMVTNVHLRNYFATWTGLTTSLGTFITFLMGYYLHYQQIAVLASIFSLSTFLCIFFFIPESPAWLYLQGRVGDAEWSQRKLRIYQPMPQANGHQNSALTSTGITLESVIDGLKKVTRKDVYKPLLIMTSVFFMIFMGGGFTITTYMVEWLQVVPLYNLESNVSINYTIDSSLIEVDNSYKYSVISGGLILISNLCASFLAIRTGIKRLTVISLACAAVGMALIGYSTLRENYSSWSKIHVLSVWLTVFMFNFGPVNVTWGIMGDVFPTDAKGFASVCMIVAATTLAVSNKLYPFLYSIYGGYLYYAYAIIILIATIFCHFFLPETVGKALDQINQTFL